MTITPDDIWNLCESAGTEPLTEAIELKVVRYPKNSEVIKIEVSGKIGRIEFAGKTTQVHLGIDKLDSKLASSIVSHKIHRTEGGKVTSSIMRKVEAAVLAKLKEMDTSPKNKPHAWSRGG